MASAGAGMRLRSKIATGLMVSSAAMTLMACYGGTFNLTIEAQ